MNMVKRFLLSKEQGVVMMETVLSLPIYFVLLAGVFWLGDFCIARLALNHGEKVRLWESGNRHSSAMVNGNDIFYFMDNAANAVQNDVLADFRGFSTISSFPVQANANRWGQVRAGQANLNVKRSAWSWGVNEGARNIMAVDNSITPGGSFEAMLSTPVQLYSRTSSTARTGIYTGNFNDTTQWLTIYGENWPDIAPGGGSAESLRSYTRNVDYLRWSR